MRAAVYYRATDIRVEEVPDPVAGPGEAVVDITVCGLCGSDLMDWYSDAKAPTVLGHEIVGRVRSLGEGARPDDGDLEVGDRVFVHHHTPCGVCDICRRGFETLCSTFKSSALDPGGFAEQVRVPAAMVRREILVLPDHVTDEQAAFIEPLACCVRGVEKARIGPGDTVVVIGLGQMGQLYARAALARGARVVGSDPVAARRELVEAAGAVTLGENPTADELRAVFGDRGVGVVAMCTGAAAAQQLGCDVAERGTTIQIFAPARPGASLPIEPNKIFFNEITVQASYSADPGDIRDALRLLADGAVNVDDMVSHRFPLAETARAMDAARGKGDSMKVLIETGR